jgi:Carboxypeptidase regulatory-like domain/TonB dependent receptor-like, beta-barrel
MTRRSPTAILLAATLLTLNAVPVLAQGSARSSLSGVVTDSGGGVLPGATVVITRDATAVNIQVVANDAGVFAVPALDAGTYTVTVTLQGFKTAVIKDVKLVAGTPANLPSIMLALGTLSETIEVRAGTELVQTQTASVTSTLDVEQINRLPVVTQNGSAFIATLAGVDTASSGHSIRNSSINGLPQSAINIMLDGINDQDNSNKSTDGFWSMVHPKLDQVEEVTVTGAVPGADSSGQGAVTIKWVTRSGTNRFDGSAYEYLRHWNLNSNYYFNKVNNLPKNEIQLHQFGVRQGGPIVRGKAFFFVNMEEFRRPASATNQRNVLSAAARAGLFRYGGGSVDLLALAARNGQLASPDATITGLLNRIDAATQSTGTVTATSDPNVNRYAFQGEGGRDEHNPTFRVDVNVTDSHRVTGTYNYQQAFQHPDLLNGNDPTFPGFANFADQRSDRNLGSYTLRSTFSSNMVNELIGGFLWSPIDFAGPLGPDQFVDQGGFNLGLPTLGSAQLTGATISTAMTQRNASHWDISDTLNWLKGSHSVSMGGNFTKVNYWTTTQTAVPQLSFGVEAATDPANAMFTNANFPGASTADLNNARALYGLLTGRVTQIGGNYRLDEDTGEYVYMGHGRQAGGMKEWGLFVNDSWRATPTLTVNLGVRWEVQMPFEPANSVYSTTTLEGFCGVSGLASDGQCNLFRPGTLTGAATTYNQYASGTPGYNTDWNNIAPSVGAAWRPNVSSGWLRTLLGDPDYATIRGGYAIGYNRDGIGTFTGVFNGNPGVSITQNRNATTGLLVPPGESWPVLLRDTARLAPLPFCSATVTTFCSQQVPVYPMAASVANNVQIFDPDFEVANTRSWTVGLQRSLSQNTALEIRYVGTRNRHQLTQQNLNEVVVVENGFADEFKLAQANLQANLAAGRGPTLAYYGPGSGTSPLPIFLANFTGKSRSLASDPAQYTGTNWTNATQVAQVGQILPGAIANGIPTGMPITVAAQSLQSNAAFRTNMLAAGLPGNFWVMNPDVNQANLTRSVGFTSYDALQLELRRRMANGFFLSGNYTLARRFTFANDTLRRPLLSIQDTAGVRHALKANWGWEIPVGRGRRFGTNMGSVLNAIAGGWEFDGVGRVQNGNLLSFGNVRVVGMSLDELRKAYKVQFRNDPATGRATVYMLPQDIIDNTIRAFNVSATSATGYAGTPPTGRYLAPANGPDCLQVVRGDCAARDVFVNGPLFTRWDISTKKTFPLGGRRTFQFQVDVINVFNAIGFNAVAQASSNATINQVTTAYSDISNTFDPGGRIGQLMFRVNW